MATMEDVYRALERADAAGDVESAKVLAKYIREQAGYIEPKKERTIGGYAKEALKGLVPGLVGLGETAITGAAALLPEEAEQAVRKPVEEFAAGVREKFAPAPGYEDTTVRKLSEAVGSTIPFLPLGALGAAGRVAATGLGVSAGAGEARQRAEQEGTTEGERGVSTALGTIPGAFEALAPIRILRRFGFGDDAVREVAGFVPALRRVAQAGGEEALQEASSQVLQNLIAKGVYKPEEAVFGGVGEAAQLGGGAGAVVGAIAELALGRRLRGIEPPPERVEEEPAVTEPEAPAAAEAAPPTREAAPAAPAEKVSPREAIERRARELRFLATQDERLKQAIENQEREEASKDDLEYLAQYDAALRARDEARRRPLGEEDQMGLPLAGGAAQLDLLAPSEPGEAIPGMYRPAEDALAGLAPRSRAYKEEAKDLGLKLDRKGNLKPNQFVPDITSQVSPDQERFEFEAQQQLPLMQPAPFEGQGDLFAQEPIPPGPTVPFTRQEPTVEEPTVEVPEEQFSLDLPGIPMARLTPRDRVLRAMAITEDKKNIPNLQFATELRPMELLRTLGDLKKEKAIAFNKKANEWELTPAGAESVRTPRKRIGSARLGRRAAVPVQPSGTEEPTVTPTGEPGVVATGETPTRSDVGEGAGEPALTEKPPMTLREQVLMLGRQVDEERRATQQRVARDAIQQVSNRRTALRTQAIDAFENDQISEKTYNKIIEQLKKPVPNFNDIEKVLSGEVKPGRKGIKFKLEETPIEGETVSPNRVREIANEVMQGWTNPPEVIVIDKVPEEQKARWGKSKGMYRNGRIFLVAEKASNEEELRGTILHESLGHYGLEQEFQDSLANEMDAIYKGNAEVRDAVAKLRTIKGYDTLNDAEATEEILAEISEKGPIKDTGLARALYRALGWIRNWLRSKGFVTKYSNNDISQVLQKAHRRVTELKKVPYDPFNPTIRYQRSPEAQRKGDRAFVNSIGKIPSSLPAVAKDTYSNAVDAASKMPSSMRQGLYSMLNLHELDRMYGKYTKALGNWWTDVNREGVALRKQQEKIENNFQKWQKIMEPYSDAERDRIYKIFMDTTVDQVEVLDLVDPSKNINWVAKKDSPVYRQFSNLKPEVQQLYKELRLSYLDYSLQMEKLLQQYMTPNEWQKMLNEFNKRRVPVYLPLFRKGNYKLTYTDKDGEYVARQFENPNQRKLARLEAQRSGAKDFSESTLGTKEADTLPSAGFFGEVVGTLTKAGVDRDVVRSIVDTYLDYLPSNSVLQLSRRREGTAGFSSNVLEAYANVADSYSRRLVNMEYMPKFSAHNEDLKADLLSAVDQNRLDSVLAGDLLSIADKQLEYIRNPNMNNLAAKVGYFSYQMYLGANISTAIVNTLDIPTVTWSRLGGKYGFGKAFNSISKATSTFFSKQKSPEMQMLIEQGLNSGVLREQQLRDLAEFKDMGSKYLEMKGRVERLTNWAFAKSDTFNRQVTLAAAYDLAKKTPEGTFDEKAFEQAQRAVYDVYGSSFPKAGPPIMGNQLARTALTFKRFAITRVNLLVSAMREARDIEPDPAVREAARKELLGYFGTAFITAGAQGMPMVGAATLLATALNGIFGDDDEPFNPDFAMREAIGLFAYKGPINYLLGVDIASRTGWTGMFWREDPRRMAEVGPVTYAMEQMLGPAYSYAVGVPRAFDYLQNEQYNRAFEQLAPRFMGNTVKALRYAEEGAITASGKPLVEDISAYNVFMQVFGFRPSEVAEAGDIAGAVKRAESKILEKRNSIITRAAIARISGDMEGFNEAKQEALEFSRRNPQYPITADTLINAIERRKKSLMQSVNGVNVNPRLARKIYGELGVEEELE